MVTYACWRPARRINVRIAVVGAGSWGTTVAAMVAPRAETTLWARRTELATAIEDDHENPDYLPGYQLPGPAGGNGDLEAALDGAAVVVMGVPSHGYRAVLEAGGTAHRSDDVPIVSLTKGIEQATLDADDRGHRGRPPRPRPRTHRRPHRTQPRQGGHRRPAGCNGRRHADDGVAAAELQALFMTPDLSGVHQPRRRRLRVGRCAEERHGDRRRHGGRSRLRRQHPGHPHHPRPRRD